MNDLSGNPPHSQAEEVEGWSVCDLEPHALGASEAMAGMWTVLPRITDIFIPSLSHLFIIILPSKLVRSTCYMIVSLCPTLQPKGDPQGPSVELSVLGACPLLVHSELSLLVPIDESQQVQGVYINLVDGGVPLTDFGRQVPGHIQPCADNAGGLEMIA